MAKTKDTPPTGRAAINTQQEGGRMRAGIRFGKEPVIVDFSTLDPEQVDALLNDPALNIRPAPADEAKAEK